LAFRDILTRQIRGAFKSAGVTQASCLVCERAGSPRDEFVRMANWEACSTCQVRHGESVPWRLEA